MADNASLQLVHGAGRPERRGKLRKSAEDLCLVTVEMGSAGFGLMLDVSDGGVGVQVMNRVEPGTDIHIAFKVPELSSRIEGTGVVTWCDGEGRLGIRFKQLKDNGSQELSRWVDSLPEATIHDPIPFPGTTMVNEQVHAIKSQIAGSGLDVDLVLQFLVERVVELTHSNGGAIALGDASQMICRASSGVAPDIGVSIGSGSALTSECLRTGSIVHCDDTETDLRVDREICRELNLRSSLILPILFEKKVRGVLEVFSPLPKAFNSQHLALLQQLSDFTAQIVFGPMPAGAATIQSSAKAQDEPELTVLSALLRATSTSIEAPAAPPFKTEAPATASKDSPPAAKPTEKPELTKAPSVIVPSNAAAAKLAPEKPAPARKPAQTKEDWPAKPAAVVSEVAAAPKPAIGTPAPKPAHAKQAAPAKPIARAAEPAVAPKPETRIEPSRTFELTFGADEDNESSSSFVNVAIAIAILLVVAIAGWFYFTRQQPASQPAVATMPSTQAPAQQNLQSTTTAPDTASVTKTPTIATQSASVPKPEHQNLVAADTVRSPNAAIVKADESTPLVIEPGTAPQRRREDPPAEAPSIAMSSNPNLPGIALPGSTARPEFKPQGVVTGGNLLKRVEPAYPAFARQQHIQGEIIITARVTKDGTLDRIKRVKGNPVFEPASFAAVRQWRYDPYKLNGQPQDVDITITLQFRLKQ